MARLSASAVNSAIETLSRSGVRSQDASLLECYLVSRALYHRGVQRSIASTERIVEEMFVVLPDQPNGRLAPFLQQSSPKKWQVRNGNGRKTIWNTGTRTKIATALFVDADIRNGLLPDALRNVANALGPPASGSGRNAQAIALLLLRNTEFDAHTDTAGLFSRLAADYGLDATDLAELFVSEPIDSDPFEGDAWAPNLLSSSLLPPRIEVPSSGSMARIPVPNIARSNDTDASLAFDDRVLRMVRTAIRAYSAVILVGPPGTGKSKLLDLCIDEIRASPASYGFQAEVKEPIWRTPDENWTTLDVLGGETLTQNGQVRFRPGLILDALIDDRWVVLDEANRADLDRIFGGLLTWLAGQQVTLGRVTREPSSPPIILGWGDTPDSSHSGLAALTGETSSDAVVSFRAGTDWRLLGTYNAVDAQRVYRFGEALGRRFARVPIPPPEPELFDDHLDDTYGDTLSASAIARIGSLYAVHFEDEATKLGPALFVKMVDYVAATAFQLLSEAEQSTPSSTSEGLGADDASVSVSTDTIEANACAEAYLINIGTWLAKFETDALERLQNRVVEQSILTEVQWNWIMQMAQHLA